MQTFVGSGFYGWVDGTGVETMFSSPSGIAFGASEWSTNLFICDLGNHVVRRANHLAEVITISNLPPSTATAQDRDGDCWLFEPRGFSIASIYEVAPSGGIIGGVFFVTNGSSDCRLAFDSKNALYVSAPEQNRIFVYRSESGWEVFAGSGNPGNVDGRGLFCSFRQPRGLAFDSADNLYVGDFGNDAIRKITPDRTVTTFLQSSGDDDGVWPFAGVGHENCAELTADPFGNIYVAQRTRVRKISPTKSITTVAGTYVEGFRDGAGRDAMFKYLSSSCLSPSGDIYVADQSDQRIRRIILSPTEQPATSQLQLGMYPGLSITGIVGRTYRIETATSLNASNWATSATIQLPESPHLWIDRESTSRQRKFYRAFLLP